MKAKRIEIQKTNFVLTLDLIEARYLCYILESLNSERKKEIIEKSESGRKFLEKNPDVVEAKSYKIYKELADIIDD